MDYGSTPELSVVIPTVDAMSERVRECIAAVRRYTEADYELVLVENHSPPQGYTDPANAGIRAAAGRYVVVLNDDVEVLEGWWPPLREALDDGALLSFADVGGFPRTDFFAAPCIALSREAIEDHGHAPGAFFDPALKVWYQDIDVLLRLCEVKRPPVPVEECRIRHKWSTTVASQDDPQLRAWIRERVREDRRAFVEKWSGGRRQPRARAILEPYLEPDERAAP